jgi:hypothetical protein
MTYQADRFCKHQLACSPGGPNCAFTYEAQVWYYDAARFYYGLAASTGDWATWEACATYYADQYSAYVDTHTIGGWRNFPHGMYLAYQRTGNIKYRNTAIDSLYRNSAYGVAQSHQLFDLLSEAYMRETSYELQAYVIARRLGEPENVRAERLVDFLFAQLDRVVNLSAVAVHQTFYDGLAMAALIDYFEYKKSQGVDVPEIPVVVKMVLDWVWTHAWNQPGHPNTLLQNPNPYSNDITLPNFCNWGCADPTADNDSYSNRLSQLVLPAFAWYWQLSGNDAYKVRGDALFQHAIRQPPFTASAATGRFTVPNHGFANGTWLRMYSHNWGGGNPNMIGTPIAGGVGNWPVMPTGSGIYPTNAGYVCNADTDSFKFDTHADCASPVPVTADGGGNFVVEMGTNYFDDGKIFMQNYRWQDYVAWRTSGAPGMRRTSGLARFLGMSRIQ